MAHKFLNRIFDNDAELIRYVQKLFGYALTGIVREQQIWFCWGTGGNGKSVLLGTVAGIMGDYHTSTPSQTLTLTTGGNERHPEEIARLDGPRLVTANEIEVGKQWNVARINQLTGGDRVEGRFMRANTFTFIPVLKLFISGNHNPH